VKFSIRQILASTVGAVCAAVIASVFGVKGTIVGVAIGSAAATMATALVAQSIERGHQAVKQVAVRAPETSTLLRKLGGTRASGASASSVDASSAPTEEVGRSEPQGVSAPETVEMASTPAPAGETERLEISATAATPATQRLRATTTPTQVARRPTLPGFSWRAIAGTVAVVFVLALLFITAVELISGKPLSAIFGGADTGTTLKNIVNPSPTPTTTPTSTTSTTSTTGASGSTTTTTAGATTTTSTTAPQGSATTTTPTTAPSTTTTGPPPGGSTTTTTASSAP
jgi:hypothetical protein